MAWALVIALGAAAGAGVFASAYWLFLKNEKHVLAKSRNSEGLTNSPLSAHESHGVTDSVTAHAKHHGVSDGASATVKREPPPTEPGKDAIPTPIFTVRPSLTATDPYPENTQVGGITWHSPYVDVRLDVVNDGPIDIEDVDFTIKMDTSIAGVGQISQFPGVTTFPAQETPESWLSGTDEAGKHISIPITTLPGGAQIAPAYRVRCSKVFANSTVHLVIASVSLNPTQAGRMPEKLFSPRRAPSSIRVKGSFSDGSKKHPLDVTRQL